MKSIMEQRKEWDRQALHEALERENFFSCLILQNGALQFQYYRNEFHKRKLQKINSCTKSFVSALVGIALDRKLIPSLHTPIVEYFPVLHKDEDPRKQQITIEQLLTMSAGFDWPEFGAWNYNPPMLQSDHWVQFVLNRPLQATPGASTNYNTGCSQLLTAILQQATGDLDEFIKTYLFAPLDIASFRWQEDPQGIKIGGYGLHLRTSDIAKFGQLFLQKGLFEHQQVIHEDWIRESTTPRYTSDNPVASMMGRYAYHWWCSELSNGSPLYFSIGFGGQILIIAPELEMVVVMTGDNYTNTLRPLNLFKKYVV